MNDREMLERAAKATGIDLNYWVESEQCFSAKYDQPRRDVDGYLWNPLTDDGDALRLAVKLKLNIHQGDYSMYVDDEGEVSVQTLLGVDPYADTRRAIVRAAAEIGKAMEE